MKQNKLNKRVLIESIMFPIAIIVVVLGFQVVQGLWLTRNYVPDIINEYASVEYLQQQVAIGIITALYLRRYRTCCWQYIVWDLVRYGERASRVIILS
ncbi:hypothetical protein [Paenibacillus lentus]|uniref:Uncharacterized protein n=1 Tax=Paenibacillus lentus TaxID=1338368 RepID=A0A3S8RQF6_9BACL|nr:hypothetical protein [Paenibacillus lentus]AZK45079.1 hypothetical protein EIM92_01780 [Paenibacillus lentus]